MRIGILGAGAIGGFFGGRLLQAGRDVTFVVRPARAQGLARDGLTIISPDGDATLSSPPTRLAGAAGEPFDAIVLACKAYDLESAIESVAPSVDARTAVLPLLNGMRHIDVLRERFGTSTVLGGECMISVTLDQAGRVVQLTPNARLSFGELEGRGSERVNAIERALSNAGFAVKSSPNILAAMWDKWVFLATNAGINCLMRGNIGEIVAAGGTPATLALLEECAAIAGASGFPISDATMAQHRTLLSAPGSRLSSSMFRDLQRGARLESDHVIADLLRRAPHARDCPMLGAAAAHLNVYAERRRQQ
jgi:2-dehydropantoate 2-reductase